MGENKAHMNGLAERSLVAITPSREKVMVADLSFVTTETPIRAEPVRMIEAAAVTLGVMIETAVAGDVAARNLRTPLESLVLSSWATPFKSYIRTTHPCTVTLMLVSAPMSITPTKSYLEVKPPRTWRG
jgi:hypothetical protein